MESIGILVVTGTVQVKSSWEKIWRGKKKSGSVGLSFKN